MLRSTIYLWIFVAASGLAIVSLLLRFVLGSFSFSLLSIVGAFVVIALSCLLAAGCERVKEHGLYPKLMISGVTASWIACLAWLVPVLSAVPNDLYDSAARIAAVPSIWAITVLIIGFMLLQQIKSPVIRKLRMLAIISVALLAFQSLSWIWISVLIEEPRISYSSRFQDSMSQLFSVLAVLACCLTTTTAIFAQLRSLMGEEVSDEDNLSFQVQCPRCTTTQTMKTSGDVCSNCGLRIKVTVI